jgi:hypothetical protein
MVVGVGGCTEAEQVPAGVVTEQRLAGGLAADADRQNGDGSTPE